MKKSTLILIITAAALIIIGSGITAAAFAVNGFDFSALDMGKYVTKTYEPEEDFDRIKINTDISEIRFEKAEGEKCSVVCFEEENLRHEVSVQDSELAITSRDTRSWIDHIGLHFKNQTVTLYLPESVYESVNIHTATGRVEIPEYFTFKTVRIDGSTSDISCKAAVTDGAKINLSTGNILLENLSGGNAELETSTGRIDLGKTDTKGNITLSSSTGRINVSDVRCGGLEAKLSMGDITLVNAAVSGSMNIETGTGNIIFENSDAKNIKVTTSTGDVRGNILTGKLFDAHTSTGNVNVPKSASGGDCEIRTSTGDIEITVGEK